MKNIKKTICLVMSLMLFLSSTVYGVSNTASIEQYESNYVLTSQNEIAKICNEISSEYLGGIYFEDETTMIVNVVESKFKQLNSYTETQNGIKVVYNPVEFSLAELEEIKEQLESYMVEYNIATIDANDVTNKIDIQLYEDNSEIYSLVSQLIDLEYVNISVLPEDYRFEFPIAHKSN